MVVTLCVFLAGMRVGYQKGAKDINEIWNPKNKPVSDWSRCLADNECEVDVEAARLYRTGWYCIAWARLEAGKIVDARHGGTGPTTTPRSLSWNDVAIPTSGTKTIHHVTEINLP
jgi:hypothetical protein